MPCSYLDLMPDLSSSLPPSLPPSLPGPLTHVVDGTETTCHCFLFNSLTALGKCLTDLRIHLPCSASSSLAWSRCAALSYTSRSTLRVSPSRPTCSLVGVLLGDDGATVVRVVISMRDVILSCRLAMGNVDAVVCVAISKHDICRCRMCGYFEA